MALLRRRIRSLAAACLVLQVGWIASFVPLDCCAGHSQPMKAEHCEHETAPQPADDCAMTGTCAGPMSALLSSLSNHGILPAPSAVLTTGFEPTIEAAHERASSRPEPPDAPPPRA